MALINASARINVVCMDASEMARRRWLGVPREERSELATSAARIRWAHATEEDRAAARNRAAKAREVRTLKTVAKLLAIDPSELSGIPVQLVSPSEFRRQRHMEQQRYWAEAEQAAVPTVCIHPRHSMNAVVSYPSSFAHMAPARK